jgi:hypothetical protein
MASLICARARCCSDHRHDLLAVLAGLPLVAVVGGWLLASRQPPVIARQPLE